MNLIKAFIVSLFLSASAYSQTISVDERDVQTGSRVILTKSFKGDKPHIEDSVAKKGALFFSVGYTVQEDAETYFIDLELAHNDNRLGCLKELTGKAILKLADGSEIECFQVSDTDCNPKAFRAAYVLMKRKGLKSEMIDNFNKLQNTQIDKIVIFTTEKQLHFKVKDDYKLLLENHFKLLNSTIASDNNN